MELSGAKAKFSTADAKKLGIKRVTGPVHDLFPVPGVSQHQHRPGGGADQRHCAQAGRDLLAERIVGERTQANGFTEGYIIKGGRFRKELGGGVSQSATTTFNAMFFAGLKDIQHQPHSLYIDRYPPGREATVAWPSLDLKFQNDTKYGVLVQAYMVKGDPGSRDRSR